MSDDATTCRASAEDDGREAGAVLGTTRGALPASAAEAASAHAWLQLATAAREDGRLDSAERAARAGLAQLGDDYRDPEASIADDTRMKILGADKAPPVERAALLERALESRLQMYEMRYDDRELTIEADRAG